MAESNCTKERERAPAATRTTVKLFKNLAVFLEYESFPIIKTYIVRVHQSNHLYRFDTVSVMRNSLFKLSRVQVRDGLLLRIRCRGGIQVSRSRCQYGPALILELPI